MAQPLAVTEDGAFTACASRAFAARLAGAGPFPSFADVLAAARSVWWSLPVTEWLAAFAAHPRIGDSVGPSAATSASFAHHSASEQAAAASTMSEGLQAELAHWNRAYYDKFGHVFLICAKGKPADAILASLKQRYHRLPHEELQAAAAQQMAITEQRLAAQLGVAGGLDAQARGQKRADQVRRAGVCGAAWGTAAPGPQAERRRRGSSSSAACKRSEQAQRVRERVPRTLPPYPPRPPPCPPGCALSHAVQQVLNQLAAASTSQPLRSPITSHVLDSAMGVPAHGLPMALLKHNEHSKLWEQVSSGVTNEDGRVGNLLPPGNYVPPGRHVSPVAGPVRCCAPVQGDAHTQTAPLTCCWRCLAQVLGALRHGHVPRSMQGQAPRLLRERAVLPGGHRVL